MKGQGPEDSAPQREDPEGFQRAADLFAGIIGTFTKHLARRHVVPEEVRFWHPAPRDTTRRTAFFEAPVRFGQPHDGLVFRTALLHEPVIGANTEVVGEAEKEATLLLEQSPSPGDFIDRVRELIDLLPPEERQGGLTAEVASSLTVIKKVNIFTLWGRRG